MTADAVAAGAETTCPFCAARLAPTERSPTLWYPTWRCACGGLGVGASPMDIDEALDELEAICALPRGAIGAVPPSAPVGASGMLRATYIDPPAIVAAAIAAPPTGWRVGSSTAMHLLDGGRSRELLVIWAIR
jgi:hypothetical protein